MNTANRKKNLILIASVSGLTIAIILGMGSDLNPDVEFLKKNNATYFAYAEQIVTTCNSDVHCTIDELNNLDKKIMNRQITLNIFLDIVRIYADGNYACHETSHHLGLWLYGYTTDLDESIQYIEMLCGGGYFSWGLSKLFHDTKVS